MTLALSELERVRTELGYNAVGVGAEPYISTVRVFDQVIRPFLTAGAATTSTTLVSAAVPPAGPGPTSLVLADATGFVAFDRVWVDVEERSEATVVQSVLGNTIVVFLEKDHGPGVDPVNVEMGEAMVREILAAIAGIKAKLGAQGAGTSSVWAGVGTLKRADEVEWYGSGTGNSTYGAGGLAYALRKELMEWRDELASVVGVRNMWRERMGQGLGVVNY